MMCVGAVLAQKFSLPPRMLTDAGPGSKIIWLH
jgi:hypothetical protein